MQPARDHRRIGRPQLGDDRQELGAVELPRVLEDRLRHFEHIAREPAHDRGRRRGVMRKLGRDDFAGRSVDAVDEPQHQLGIVPRFLGRVRGLLNVEVGQHPHQRRPNVDAAAQRQSVQPFEIAIRKRLRHDRSGTQLGNGGPQA